MELVSYNEYVEITTKLLRAYPNQIQTVLKSEDHFHYLVGEIMWADNDFDGRGNIYGYRKKRFQWAMGKLKRQFSRNKNKPQLLSINNMENSISTSNTTLVVENKEIIQKFIDQVKNSKVLTDNEKYLLYNFFIEHIRVVELSKQLNLTNRSIYRSIKRGLEKLGIQHGDFRRLRNW
jgi:hypothetical protein